MKIHWSPKSPYVRKVMVVAHEVGLNDQIERVRSVALTTAVNPAIQADNPLGKIPTLILADGSSLYDSLVICEYLGETAQKPMIPASGDARWECLKRHALGSGLTDALIYLRNERNRSVEKQLEPLIASLETKVFAALDRLESTVGAFSPLPFDVGHAALGCALSYIDFRFPDIDWRAGRTDLTTWHTGFESRPAALANPVIDG